MQQKQVPLVAYQMFRAHFRGHGIVLRCLFGRAQLTQTPIRQGLVVEARVAIRRRRPLSLRLDGIVILGQTSSHHVVNAPYIQMEEHQQKMKTKSTRIIE